MLPIQITETSEIYALKGWLYNNVGEHKTDWWLTPMRANKNNPYAYDMELHLLNDAHELLYKLSMTGKYFTSWRQSD